MQINRVNSHLMIYLSVEPWLSRLAIVVEPRLSDGIKSKKLGLVCRDQFTNQNSGGVEMRGSLFSVKTNHIS